MSSRRAALIMASVYVVIAFAASGLLLLIQPLTGLDPGVLSLTQLGPAAAVLVLVAFGRRPLAVARLTAVGQQRAAVDLVLALSAALIFAGVLAAMAWRSGFSVPGAVGIGRIPFVAIVLTQLVGATAEEMGWRGLLQPLLERVWPRPFACVVVGLVWGGWHVQVFAAGAVATALFLGSTIALSFLLGYLARGSFWQRVLVAAAVHWLVNLATLMILGDDTGRSAMIGSLVAVVIPTVLVLTGVGLVHRLRSDRSR